MSRRRGPFPLVVGQPLSVPLQHLTRLAEELERLWHAPADTPAYRKGVLSPDSVRDRRTVTEAEQGTIAQGVADDATRAAADIVVAALSAMAAAVADKEEELGRIDAVAGDGDHGRGMVRGTAAAVDAARKSQAAGNGPGRVLVAAGEAWAARAGGTSGVLWGAALAALGGRIGEAGRDRGR